MLFRSTWKDAWTDPVRAARASHNAGWYAESGNEGGDTYTIAVPTLSAAVTGYSIAADKTTAAAGDTVTVTITAASTCAAATDMTVAVTPTTTVIASQGVTNAANTAGTFAFTFTMPAANVTAITGTVSTGSGEPETHTHTWSAATGEAKEATCTATGLKQYYTCTGENCTEAAGTKFVGDGADKTKISSDDELVIAKKDHSYTYAVSEDDPAKHIGTCSTCNEGDEGHTTEPAEHTFAADATSGDKCTANGCEATKD